MIPDLFMKKFRLSFLPIFQGLHRGFMFQSPLWNVLVV
jgi:hypothetical protein